MPFPVLFLKNLLTPRSVSDYPYMKGQQGMDIEKLIQVAGYILGKYGGVLNYTKLIKILYLADRKSLSETGYPITGDSYYSMKNGPVLSSLYDLVRNKYDKKEGVQYYWNSKFTKDGYDIHMTVGFIPHGLLSDYELETLDTVDERFHSLGYGDLIDFVHDPSNCPEWQDTDSSIPLRKERILSVLGFSEDEIEFLSSEEASYSEEDRVISSLSKEGVAGEVYDA